MPTELPNDISLQGLNVTRSEEGRSLRAYQDSVGVWTIGYGLTNYDKNLPWKVAKGLTITEEQAEWYLLKSVRENYLPDVRKTLMGGTYAHPQGAVDGGLDFHFNTGGIKKATWPAALGRGDLAAAKNSMLSWNKAGGNVLAGLTRRRARNWGQVSAGDYGHVTGPSVIGPAATSDREHVLGTGDVLTAMPKDPRDSSAGSVKDGDIPVTTFEAPGVLKLGSAGQAVTDLQNSLNEVALPTAITGVYDDPTKANVVAFQKTHPTLTADGKVGPATKAAIARDIQLRKVTTVVVKTATPALPTMYITLHQWLSANAGEIALCVGVAVVVSVAVYYGIRYRNEIHAQFNKLTGRSAA